VCFCDSIRIREGKKTSQRLDSVVSEISENQCVSAIAVWNKSEKKEVLGLPGSERHKKRRCDNANGTIFVGLKELQ
jgi:hypothetical protein